MNDPAVTGASAPYGREESRFIRKSLPITKDFSMVRNWWLRRTEVAGNPISLYLYLLSHDEDYTITLKRAMTDLGMGRTAFTSARRALEAIGMLTTETVRHPAGTVDAGGRSLAGQVVRVDFVLQDPVEPQRSLKTKGSGLDVGFVHQSFEPAPGSVDNSHSDKQFESDVPDSTDVRNLTSGSVHVKEDQVKENQSSSSSSSSDVAIDEVEVAAVAASPEDEDDSGPLAVDVEPGLAKVLREVHSRLDASLLLSRLAKLGIDPLALNLELAASVAIFASPRPVGDPVAYLVGAIRREPYRWIKQPSGAGNEHWSPAVLSCDAGVHLYGTPRSDPWQMVCLRCGEERDGWREQRDADEASGRAAS